MPNTYIADTTQYDRGDIDTVKTKRWYSQ